MASKKSLVRGVCDRRANAGKAGRKVWKSLETALLGVGTTWLVGSLRLDVNLRMQLSHKKPQRPKPAKRAH
ncbi:MAG UNVERIFIED_CONTAM: hypothetical protein LVR18_03910 [Planctomycetaceae bacterium]